MNRKAAVELTNMCMIYDSHGNVLVEEKLVNNTKGLIFPGGHVESNESISDSMIQELKKKETLWHLDMMLEIFEGNGMTELYFNRSLDAPAPELK